MNGRLTEKTQRFRVLFLSFDDSARGLMAEAVLNSRGKGRFEGVSAGVQPTADANACAMEALRDWNVPAPEHAPRAVEGLERLDWDFVITLSERARMMCPAFPAGTFVTHWSTPDPAEEQRRGAEEAAAVRSALLVICRRIDLLVTLPLERLGRLATEGSLRAIGQVYSRPVSSKTDTVPDETNDETNKEGGISGGGRLTLLRRSAVRPLLASVFSTSQEPRISPA